MRFIHGYHVAFVWGAGLLTAALLCAVLLVNAKKDDVPTEAAMGDLAASDGLTP